MAGTVTVTKTQLIPSREGQRIVTVVNYAWTSTAGGAASGTSGSIGYVNGQIAKVVFTPGTGGDQPTNLYDVTLTDANGFDVLAGQGADLSNAAASAVCPGVQLKDGTTTSVVPVVVSDILTLSVTNAGATKSGNVTLYLD